MRYLVQPTAPGDYFTKGGATVSLVPAEHGKDYADEAAAAAALHLTVRALYVARQTKFAELQRAFDATIAAGFTDSGPVGTGGTYALDDDSRTSFHQLLGVMQASGAADDAAIGWGDAQHAVNGILDIAGGVHELTYGQYKAFLDRYSICYGGARAKLVNLSAAVATASTVEAINAIV